MYKPIYWKFKLPAANSFPEIWNNGKPFWNLWMGLYLLRQFWLATITFIAIMITKLANCCWKKQFLESILICPSNASMSHANHVHCSMVLKKLNCTPSCYHIDHLLLESLPIPFYSWHRHCNFSLFCRCDRKKWCKQEYRLFLNGTFLCVK